MSGIGKAAAEEAAWAKLQRSAVWWLGEHANAAALEYAGDNEAVKATAAVNAAMQRTTSPGEIIAMQVCLMPCFLPSSWLASVSFPKLPDLLLCRVAICLSCFRIVSFVFLEGL